MIESPAENLSPAFVSHNFSKFIGRISQASLALSSEGAGTLLRTFRKAFAAALELGVILIPNKTHTIDLRTGRVENTSVGGELLVR